MGCFPLLTFFFFFRVMIEALQNHTPRTIVVDEISNNLEARACQDIKAR